MDYGFFDGLLDSVFVVGSDRGIVYCNEAAAKFCESSVRRLAKGKPIFDTIEFSNAELFIMPNGQQGESEPFPYQEIEFKLKSGKSGKVQVAIQPFAEPSGDKRWAVMIRDVTIEEVLHAKHQKQLEQLEAYSKNLEQMVEVRTREVNRANVMLNAIMNSLGQGFFVFDQAGECLPFFTRACVDILEGVPAGKKVWDVLKVPADEKATFEMWMKAVFSETLPFDALKDLGPSEYKHSQQHHIKLEFFAIRDEAQTIVSVVVVATDKTSEFLANQALEREKKFARMVVKLMTSRRQFTMFLASIKQMIDEIGTHVSAYSGSQPKLDHEWLYRALHTLEGEAATYSAQEIWAASRACQETLEPLRKGKTTDSAAVLANFNRSLVDLRTHHAQFLETNHDLFQMLGALNGDTKIEFSRSEIESLLSRLQQMGLSPKFFAEIEDQLLREPIENLVNHYQDTINMLAEKMSKKIDPLVIRGGENRIYADNYKGLLSAFVHVFRNCIDHGIEASEEREMMGKPASGHIEMKIEPFQRSGSDWLRLKVIDDGRGISASEIRTKWAAKTNDGKVEKMSDHEVLQLVFASGFSTRAEVGEYSGRGVGMNVIKIEAEALGGQAWVESTMGQGTRTIVEVPDLPRVARLSSAA